ncbi:hypothetical protein [Roseobacter sp.]|uniref:hypothetical protein n=1 Tax=Roseobacter sp. TaxID=1907202 RepID=UPI0038590211
MLPYQTSARVALAATFSICLTIGTATAGEMSHGMEHMATETQPAQPIADTIAKLEANSRGVRMSVYTRELVPGHVTTAWWVIMTIPEACYATPCPAEDVIGRADEVGTQIVYADGAINAADGTASFAAYLPAGAVPNGWYDQDVPDPRKAEIHLVLNDHGPLIEEIAASMLTSYRGGCSDESLPPPFPASAKSDGIAGPNQCALIQDAIFVQAQ